VTVQKIKAEGNHVLFIDGETKTQKEPGRDLDP
jgi:hypothetical protein